MLGVVRSGSAPLRSQRSAHAGRRSASGENFTIVFRSSFSGMLGLPQSRPWENDQSSVTMIPAAPAARARSTRARMTSLEPDQ